MALSFAQEDAEEELLAKALYVDNNDDGSGPFDATYQPSTAEDYLKGVMREAKSIGEVSIGTYYIKEACRSQSIIMLTLAVMTYSILFH